MNFTEDRRSRKQSLGRWPGRLLLSAAMLLLTVMAGTMGAVASPPQMTIVEFGLVDTSGEARDQRGEHEARLQALMQHLRSDLAASGKFLVTDLPCDAQPCRADDDAILERARRAGVKFVVFGRVHKMSTLVLSLPVRVIDAGTGNIVFQRFHSFRGDTDEAWQRAARFLARELAAEVPGK
jgi:hypothetical protein